MGHIGFIGGGGWKTPPPTELDSTGAVQEQESG